MTQLNRDPHAAGYVHYPTGAVTAELPPGADVPDLLRALGDAGFGPDSVHVFRGEAGAEVLDLSGERHGGWVHFRREMQGAFTDESKILDHADSALRAGGVLVAVYCGTDEARKRRAAEVLESRGGQEVWHWGKWALETPDVGPSPRAPRPLPG
jgi:hypothetical protein